MLTASEKNLKSKFEVKELKFIGNLREVFLSFMVKRAKSVKY